MLAFAMLCHSTLYAEGVEDGTSIYMCVYAAAHKHAGLGVRVGESWKQTRSRSCFIPYEEKNRARVFSVGCVKLFIRHALPARCITPSPFGCLVRFFGCVNRPLLCTLAVNCLWCALFCHPALTLSGCDSQYELIHDYPLVFSNL